MMKYLALFFLLFLFSVFAYGQTSQGSKMQNRTEPSQTPKTGETPGSQGNPTQTGSSEGSKGPGNGTQPVSAEDSMGPGDDTPPISPESSRGPPHFRHPHHQPPSRSSLIRAA
nr:uncharacterized protein LOC106685632 [Halyomorpha halys]